MAEYCYMMLDEVGATKVVGGPGTMFDDQPTLSELLRDGWRPVRETPFARGRIKRNQILLVLEQS